MNENQASFDDVSTEGIVSEMRDAMAQAGMENSVDSGRRERPKRKEPVEVEQKQEPEETDDHHQDNVEEEIVVEKEQHKDSEPEYTYEEKIAIEQGWKPKHRYLGVTKNYRDAKEFLLYNNISANKKELQRVQESLKLSSELNRKLYEMSQKDRLNWFEQQRKAAIEISSVDDVDRYDKAIKETREELDKYSPQQESASQRNQSSQVAPEVREFVAKHSWMTDSSEEARRMQRYAVSFDTELGQRNPNLSMNERLARVEDEVKEVFYKHFENKNRSRASSVNVIAPENVSIRKSVKKKYAFNDLPHSVRESVKDMARLSGMPLDDYAQQLYETGYLKDE